MKCKLFIIFLLGFWVGEMILSHEVFGQGHMKPLSQNKMMSEPFKNKSCKKSDKGMAFCMKDYHIKVLGGIHSFSIDSLKDFGLGTGTRVSLYADRKLKSFPLYISFQVNQVNHHVGGDKSITGHDFILDQPVSALISKSKSVQNTQFCLGLTHYKALKSKWFLSLGGGLSYVQHRFDFELKSISDHQNTAFFDLPKDETHSVLGVYSQIDLQYMMTDGISLGTQIDYSYASSHDSQQLGGWGVSFGLNYAL